MKIKIWMNFENERILKFEQKLEIWMKIKISFFLKIERISKFERKFQIWTF
jgi:hypothetical protein